MKSSDVSGFYKKSPEDRWQTIRGFGELTDAEIGRASCRERV